MCTSPTLNLDVDVDKRNGGWSDARNAGGLSECLGGYFSQFLLHFARKAADGTVIEPVWNAALLRLLQTIDRALLLVEISGVFDLSLDGLELVTDFGGKRKLRVSDRGDR